MRIRRLRTRIVVFFVALLATVQIVSFALISFANTNNARQKIAGELEVGERIFARLLDQNRERLTQAARVLSADYGFREALASNDLPTVQSALRNHGARVRADVMMLAALDQRMIASTGEIGTLSTSFPIPALIDEARRKGAASSLEVLGGDAYQIVVVPVLAPVPIGWVALGFKVDDAIAEDLRQLTSLNVSFMWHEDKADWSVLASTVDVEARKQLQAALDSTGTPVSIRELGEGEAEQQLRVIPIEQHGQKAVVAVLQRSVAEAMRSFERLRRTLLGLAVLSLALTVVGSVVLAAGITRPLRQLARAAMRIRRGDYETRVESSRQDELGVLAHSLDHMRGGIADREKQILRLAYQDSLTDLPNRARFNECLVEAIEKAMHQGDAISVMMLDLDRFKYVNDTLGHSVGDHVLREVSGRLSALLEPSDVIARLGGDEFAILVAGGSARVLPLANRIIAALEEPIVYEQQPVDVGTSVGAAHFPQHGSSASTLLRNADVAMYVAKRNKLGFAVFDSEYDTHQQLHLSLLGELRRAVEKDELRVFYQPKVTLSTSRVGAVEALLRWEHPTRGLVPPIDFIPFAEHTGYIKVLTRWVLEESIRQCGEWLRDGLELRVSINISARDLMNRELPNFLSMLLERYETPPDLICLEITESGFMEDPTHAQKVLERLRALGLHLSIDDYGTGFSSLSYIVRLPVDELKIDRSFIQRMASDPTTATIVRSTIDLGHNLGLKVVAEGVEDAQGMKLLAELGCDQAQGYFMSPPLPPERLVDWLKTSAWADRAGKNLEPVHSEFVSPAVAPLRRNAAG